MKLNPPEEHHRNFLYEGYLRNFISKDLGKCLGMSFDDYLSRSRYEMAIIHTVVDDINTKKQEANKALLNDLQAANDKSKLKPPEQ